ncbi:hypothetical protein [Flagellimonas pelagia]|uniref:Uncharacterized protein n=1 Tax=Flagellimonas pelagia TaxID=2306998 RepID=A0A3A1NKI2_9FLAO|nr:hypothetical protein [Allomuricauda maritima]RIV46742.1 hypothetical protein D2V05_01940 [Allomuricauda maritima]TXJ99626.1 hypothetical protein FQ017_01925 [Allomuricauda maritima]
MKIKYNQTDRSIEIKDSVKNSHFTMKFLMILNLANAVLNLSDVPSKGFGFIQILWGLMGATSIAFLYFLFFKKSSLEKIPLEMVQGLREKTSFGKKRFYIALNNGKNRDLMDLKTQVEFDALKKVFIENGIPN